MNKYFVYCPQSGFETFDTIEARDKYAEETIASHLDDGWSEEVDQVCVGIVTGKAEQVDLQEKPERSEFATEEEFENAMEQWPDSCYDSICRYEIEALPESESAKDFSTTGE